MCTTYLLGTISRSKKYYLLRLALQGKIDGQRSRGRRKTEWIKNIKEWTEISHIRDLTNRARNRRFIVVVRPCSK